MKFKKKIFYILLIAVASSIIFGSGVFTARFWHDCPPQSRFQDKESESLFQHWLSSITDEETAKSASMNWSQSSNYNIVYVADGFVSFYYKNTIYTGGAHANHQAKVGTFFCGKRLRLADLPELDKIEKLFQQALKSHKDFESIKRYCHNLSQNVQLTENFYIDNEGIHFIYDPYEIACFAVGTVDILVPYKVDYGAK